MSRAWPLPVAVREAAPTPAAVQQSLSLTATPVRRLWFCIYLPKLPLEACRASVEAMDDALAIVAEQQGIQRVLLTDARAAAAGIMAGQSVNAALALLPALRLEERNLACEQQVLEALATWLERFSSFVSIAGRNVLLLEIAGSVRLFGGLKHLRQKISDGCANRVLQHRWR